MSSKTESNPRLRVPQARVLRSLLPASANDPISEWPLLTRAAMAIRAGYTPASGSITRALIGIHEGSSSGDAHLGLLPLGYVTGIEINVDGIKEINYRITRDGIDALREYLLAGGTLPPLKDAVKHTNKRYKEVS